MPCFWEEKAQQLPHIGRTGPPEKKKEGGGWV